MIDEFQSIRQHRLRNTRIFGSIACGEETVHSDIDFLVDLDEGCTLFDLGGASVKLQILLGRVVSHIILQNTGTFRLDYPTG